MSLEICEYLNEMLFSWTLSTDRMPAGKDNCRKADLCIYIGERKKPWQWKTVLN